MAIRIIEIEPKIALPPPDPVLAHLTIKQFKWIDESSLKRGVTNLAGMFDWIVNKKGQAYVKKSDGGIAIPVFGAVAPTGQQYIRCINNNTWSNELLDLPQIS